MALWIQGFKHVNHWEVDEHEDQHEDELVNNEILVSCDPPEEPSVAAFWDYLILSKAEKLT